MALPVVAIVGRPNVGKSSLLNALAGRRISIVDPTAGVTRDRVSVVVAHDDVYFDLVDTGGYGIEDADGLTQQVEAQIALAVSSAALVLFVTDIRDGLTPLDRRVAELLHRGGVEVMPLANKIDCAHEPAALAEFEKLGFGPPMPISALHSRGRRDLLEQLVRRLRPIATEKPTEPVLRLAIVGRRNVGKSTFINALAGEERMIVSEVPGTTRDSVDVRFTRDGRTYVAIDTAGVRKRRKIADDIEFYGMSRAERSVRRADVVLFFMDATSPFGEVDKRLAHFIAEQFKPCVFVINKWDLARDRAETEAYGEYLTRMMPNLAYPPIAFVTARTGKNVQSTLDLAAALHKQASQRVSTATLNNAFEEIVALRGPSPKRGARRPKVFYATQIGVNPPTIVLFVNDPGLIREDYQRFLLNALRQRLPFAEVPIRLLFRSRAGPRREAGAPPARPPRSRKGRSVKPYSGGRS